MEALGEEVRGRKTVKLELHTNENGLLSILSKRSLFVIFLGMLGQSVQRWETFLEAGLTLCPECHLVT
jgi:hypothetical protein